MEIWFVPQAPCPLELATKLRSHRDLLLRLGEGGAARSREVRDREPDTDTRSQLGMRTPPLSPSRKLLLGSAV